MKTSLRNLVKRILLSNEVASLHVFQTEIPWETEENLDVTVILDVIPQKYSDSRRYSQKSDFRRYSSKIVILDVFSPKFGDFGSYSNKNLNLDHLHLKFLTIFQIWTISI